MCTSGTLYAFRDYPAETRLRLASTGLPTGQPLLGCNIAVKDRAALAQQGKTTKDSVNGKEILLSSIVANYVMQRLSVAI